MAYHYLESKEEQEQMVRLTDRIIHGLADYINENNILKVDYRMVGSGSRHMITQNGRGPVDVDYNLIITAAPITMINTKQIKDYIQNCFNITLRKYHWEDCNDSTSVLTTKKGKYLKNCNLVFSIDLGIIQKYDYPGNWKRLIHHKTKDNSPDQWIWNEIRDSNQIEDRVNILKGKSPTVTNQFLETKIKESHWLEVRETYLEKKNMYISRQDHDHPSFICYIEAVNEVYYKYYR